MYSIIDAGLIVINWRDLSHSAEAGASRLPAKPGINYLVVGLCGEPEGPGEARASVGGIQEARDICHSPTFTNIFQHFLTVLSCISINQPNTSPVSTILALGSWPRWDHHICLFLMFLFYNGVCTHAPVVSNSLPWTVTHQVPLPMEFSRQECWNGLPFPTPGDLLHPGIEPAFLKLPAFAGRFFTIGATWEVT